MAFALGNMVQALLLAALLATLGGQPAALAPPAGGLPSPGPPGPAQPADVLPPAGGPAGTVGVKDAALADVAEAPAQPQPHGSANIIRSSAGAVESDTGAAVTAIDAAPISERRARAVAMTVFSLGTVISAGFLAIFLIKRLL